MIRKYLINFIAGKLFKLVIEEEILATNRAGQLCFNGVPLTQDQKATLKSQADTIRSSELWRLLVKDMTFVANKKIYFESKSENDIMFAKCTLWTLDVICKKIDNISSLK